MKLPDCMMPDGADPCEGYHKLGADIAKLQVVLREALDAIAADHASLADPDDPYHWDDTELLALYRRGERLLGCCPSSDSDTQENGK